MRRAETVELSDGSKIEVQESNLADFRKLSTIIDEISKDGATLADTMSQVIAIACPGLEPETLPMSDAAKLYTATMRINNVADIIKAGATTGEGPEKKA